jgi:Vitamin K-dependent gamma-carboxylase, lumenal domain
MSQYPDMLQQYALFLANQFEQPGKAPVEVRASVFCSLNGRRPQLFVEPRANLAGERLSWKPLPWILPLKEPLPEDPWLIPQAKWPRYIDLREAQRLLVSPQDSTP